MFRKARIQTLVRKINKYIQSSNGIGEGSSNNQERDIQDWTRFSNAFTQIISRNLDENQLRTLLKSLENKGGIDTDCIWVGKESEVTLQQLGLGRQANVLFCKVLRWPDLENYNQLKTLINCQNYDGCFICGNPFHYSRTTKKGQQKRVEMSNGPGVEQTKETNAVSSRISDDGFSGEEETEDQKEATNCNKQIDDFTDSQFSSNFQTPCTNEVSSASSYDPWCSIAYWEIRRRIGRIFDVTSDCVNVFYELPQGDGMCIGLLDQVERSPYVNKVRKHIGFGFQLTQEYDGIWIYNRSDYCIFVSAPASQQDHSLKSAVVRPEVTRVPSGHCFHAVDFRRPFTRTMEQNMNVFCIRVSFAKGWGENYTRQFITSCPCWTEIYLKESCLALMGRL